MQKTLIYWHVYCYSFLSRILIAEVQVQERIRRVAVLSKTSASLSVMFFEATRNLKHTPVIVWRNSSLLEHHKLLQISGLIQN